MGIAITYAIANLAVLGLCFLRHLSYDEKVARKGL